ncbi:MAG: dephospho-CoA kinase [Elusimicrobiota bacterium]|jgi:dephospho-CoA kinase|nr:dephospho-CoA kinase [Elusimicrobiota bacterium]
MILGLTGTIGCGKSETAKIFKQLGAEIIDADKISKQLTSKGSPALKELVEIFGKQILSDDGALNRKVLAQIIFNDDKQRLKAEQILHPLIIKDIKEKVKAEQKSAGIVVIDAPLLFETGLDKICDKIVVVVVDKDVWIKRIVKAGKFSVEEIKKRAASQLSDGLKAKKADYIIDNSGDKKELCRKVKTLFETLTGRTDGN